MTCNLLPASISAGLTLNQVITLPGYPATEWSLTVLLRGPKSINVPTTSEGDRFKIYASAGVTETWPPGNYWYSLRVSRGDDVIDAARGQLTITPDMADIADGYDGRTENEIALAAIEAVIAKRATMDQERYRINNRELYRTSIADLLRLRSHYIALVNRERAKACGISIWGQVIRVSLK